MRLLVIDGNSIANRAFFGIKLLTTKDGRYTNAIYGFLNILLSLLKECDPDEVAVAFDLRAPTFRHKMYDGYKATRHGMPEELAQQMPVLKELLADLGYRAVLPGHRRPRQPAAGEREHHRTAGRHRHGPEQDHPHGCGRHPREIRH